MSWIKKCLTNLMLVFLSVAVTLLCLETALRFTDYKGLLVLTTDGAPRYYFKADPELGIDISKNFPPTYAYVKREAFKYKMWSNELGCFDMPYKGETGYILLTGDSFAQYYAPFEDKWGTRLEKILDQRVLKAGVGGYGTKHAYIKAKRIIKEVKNNPSLIVVSYYMNDMRNDFEFPELTVVDGYVIGISHEDDVNQMVARWQKYGIPGTPRHPLLRRFVWWIRRHSILFNICRGSLKKTIVQIPVIGDLALKSGAVSLPEKHPHVQWAFKSFEKYPWLEERWQAHFENLKAFKGLADQVDSELFFVMIPTKEQVYRFFVDKHDFGEKIDFDQPKRLLGEFFEDEEIHYIDLLESFQESTDHTTPRRLNSRKDLYWRTDPHWNIKGNHLASLLVAEYILENDLLDVEAKDEKLELIKEKLGSFD